MKNTTWVRENTSPKSVLLEMLKLMGMAVAGWFLWILIFAGTTVPEGEENIPYFFQQISLVLGLLTGVAIFLGLKFNTLHRSRQQAAKKESNIHIAAKHHEKLLDQATRVVEKYMLHEESTLVGVAKARSNAAVQVRTATQFQGMLERYPALKANEHVGRLLEQIEASEDAVAHAKYSFNEEVAEFNTMLHSFPVVLFRWMLPFTDLEYLEDGDTDEITDEMLGL